MKPKAKFYVQRRDYLGKVQAAFAGWKDTYGPWSIIERAETLAAAVRVYEDALRRPGLYSYAIFHKSKNVTP